MITFYDRNYTIIAQAVFDGAGDMIAYDDRLQQDLESGLSTYTFTIDKISKDLINITIGSYVSVDVDHRKLWFELLETDENNHYKTFTCIDAGLDLIGETVQVLSAESEQPITYYVNHALKESGWTIGTNELSQGRQKLEFKELETTTKRLQSIVSQFNGTIDYEIKTNNGKPFQKLVHLRKKKERDSKLTLEYGREITSIKKVESIQQLITGLVVTGKNDMTLEGYRYDDGRYYVVGKNLYDRITGKQWKRHNATDGGYIMGAFSSDAETKEELFNAALEELKKRSVPQTTYTVDVSELPLNVVIGDYITMIDYDYLPALRISSQVIAIEKSISQPNVGKIVLANFTTMKSSIDERLQRLSQSLQEYTDKLDDAPYIMTIRSENGTIFQNGKVNTRLIATVTQNGLDVSSYLSYRWNRISTYNTTGDNEWNRQHAANTRVLSLTAKDVDNSATFVCKATIKGIEKVVNTIVITDLTFETATGVTPPKNPETGMIWIDTSTKPSVQKIYLDNQWVKVVDETDVNALRRELTAQVNSVDKKIDAHQSKTETAVSTLNQQSNTLKTNLEITEQQLRLLREQQALAKQELQARATLAELEEWKRLYQAFVAKEEREQKNSEQALVIQSQGKC